MEDFRTGVRLPPPPPFDSMKSHRGIHRVEWCPEKASRGSAPKDRVSAFQLAHGRPADETIRMPWFVYILRCSDLSYYVGHTENPQQRVITHNAGRGPVHTSRRLPVELVYYEEMCSKAAAVQRERQIKKWSRSKKQALIAGDSSALKNLSHRRNKTPPSR